MNSWESYALIVGIVSTACVIVWSGVLSMPSSCGHFGLSSGIFTVLPSKSEAVGCPQAAQSCLLAQNDMTRIISLKILSLWPVCRHGVVLYVAGMCRMITAPLFHESLGLSTTRAVLRCGLHPWDQPAVHPQP